MSSIITGDPSTVSNTLSATIVEVTDTSPPVVETTAPHLFSTFDVVEITGNTPWNGTYTITVVDSDHFSLDGIVGMGGAASPGGTAIDRALTPAFTIPSDGDGPIQASDVNPALEALADRTQFLAGFIDRVDDLTAASGTWTAPDGVYYVDVEGCGGGGGGGGGTAGDTSAGTANGGGGGGGAELVNHRIAVVPGVTYNYTRGTAGAAGAGGAAAGDGGDGVFDTTYKFPGAAGGRCAGTLSSTDFALGGISTRNATSPDWFLSAQNYYTTDTGIVLVQQPGQGGPGRLAGMPSRAGYAGGATGAQGTNAAGHAGGYGGGGGGGGAYAAGGAGGTGGDGSAAGAGAVGVAGTAGAANTGAGGGGGGGGGCGGASGGAGGAGGAGGTGKMRVKYRGPQANHT